MRFAQQLTEQYHDRLYRYVALRLQPADVEDVVQQILLRALQRQHQRTSDTGGWLFAIARTVVADHYRARQREGTMHTQQTPDAATASVDLGPLERLERTEFHDRLRRRLDQLPDREREAIQLRFTSGLGNGEIAALLDVTPNHLGVILHRGLTRLRGLMLAELAQ